MDEQTKSAKSKKMTEEEEVIFGIPVLMKMFHLWGTKTKGKWLYYTIFIQLLFGILYGMQNIGQIVFSVLIIDDLSEFVTSLILVLTAVKAQIKQILALVHGARVESILRSFHKCYHLYTPHTKNERQIIFQHTNKYMTNFFYIYYLITAITAISWLSQTFFKTPSERSHLYTKIEIEDFNWALHSDLWIPFPIRNRLLFGLVNGTLWFNYFCEVGTFVMTDVCILLLIKYLEGHLKILGLEILRSGDDLKEPMDKNIIRCIKYHQELMRICQQIQIVSELDVLFSCFSFIFSISFCGFIMTKISILSTVMLKITSFIVWSITQLYFLMNAGDKVYNEMLELATHIYYSKWIDQEKPLVRMLVISITQKSRMSNPIKATHFIAITRESFSRMMNTSFSYLTLLKNIE